MGADREAACPHRRPGSVRWVLPTLSRVDFGLPGCWVAAGIPCWFRAAEACELFPQHTWALWSYFADSALLLSHWHSRPSRLCHFLPLETALGYPTHRTCYLCQGVTLVLNIAAPWQLLWRLAFFSFPWTPGRLWGTFSTMWGLGAPRQSSWPLSAIPLPQKYPHTCARAHSETVSSKTCNHPFFLLEVSILLSPSHLWGLMLRQLWWRSKDISPASLPISSPPPSTRKAFDCLHAISSFLNWSHLPGAMMMERFPWLWGGNGKQYFYWSKK